MFWKRTVPFYEFLYEFLCSSTVTGNLSEKACRSPQDHQIRDMLGHRRCRMIQWAWPDNGWVFDMFDLYVLYGTYWHIAIPRRVSSPKFLKVSLTSKFQAKQLAFAQPSSSKSHQPELDRAGVPPGPPKLLAELDSSARQSPTNGPPPRSLRISLVNPAISLLQLAVACHCEYSFLNTISRYYITMFHSPHVNLQPTNRPFAWDDECWEVFHARTMPLRHMTIQIENGNA